MAIKITKYACGICQREFHNSISAENCEKNHYVSTGLIKHTYDAFGSSVPYKLYVQLRNKEGTQFLYAEYILSTQNIM